MANREGCLSSAAAGCRAANMNLAGQVRDASVSGGVRFGPEVLSDIHSFMFYHATSVLGTAPARARFPPPLFQVAWAPPGYSLRV